MERSKTLRTEMDFMALYNSYEPQCKQRASVYFKKENKTITVKTDIILWFPHCSEALLMEGCHQLACSLVIFLNTDS